MDKVALDTFEPSSACFDPPPTDPAKKDDCVVSTTFHNREDPTASQPPLRFQREKDHFILVPGDVGIPVAQAMGFDEKSSLVQSTLHFSVFLNRWFKDNYPDFKNKKSYTGPDLLPLSARAANFIASGNIESPDATQRKNTFSLLRELILRSDDEKLWFNSMFGTLNDPKGNQKLVPLPMRPRVQWLVDQMALHEEFRKAFSQIKGPETEKATLRRELTLLAFDLHGYIATGEGNLKDIRDRMDRLAGQVQELESPPPELHDLFDFFAKKVNGLTQNTFFQNNPEAKKRLYYFQGYLNSAVSDHRADLLGLAPLAAFRQSLTYELQGAADRSNLSSRVRAEMDEANLTPTWMKSNVKEVSGAIVPHLTLVQQTGQPPRVQADVNKIIADCDALVASHYIQEREYRIGILAVLRYLFGQELSGDKMQAWVNNQNDQAEIDLTSTDQKKLKDYGKSLERKVGKSISQTGLILPITEGVIGAGGLGLGIYGLVKEKGDRNIFTTVGASALGAGGASLTCHALWKSRNQYITDGICGVIGGVGLGLAAGFLLPSSHGGGPITMPPPMDGRNPVPGYGP